MSKPLFTTSFSLPAKLTDVEREAPAKAETPSAEREQQLLAEKSRQDKKDREAVERVLQNMLEAAGSLRTAQQKHLEQMQQLAIELAVAIASRLLHDRLEAGAFPVETLVREVVERLDTPQPVTVLLHPDDLALLRQRLGEGRAPFPHGADVKLTADATLARGEVRAQAGDVSVLANLDEQLIDIGRALRATLPAAAQEEGADLRPFEGKRQSA